MKYFLGLICIGFFITAHSQNLPNTLLWRISGKGLQKPSFLYGTMHLTDQRLFNLGDSLYKAIENTEGFAIEVNPDEITAFMIDEMSQEIKNAKFIKDVLTEKEYKDYSSSLSKKLKKPADEITTRDIFIEKNKWVRESFQKGEMSTFLDAYLYDIARRQGRWTGGVENMDDQKGLVNDLVDESDIRQIAGSDKADRQEEANGFIKLYLNSDLNAIDAISNASDIGYIDKILIKRNIKMARRMDSLNKIRSMVFAVGAAHLPGKEGLINLLQKIGYTVQPVFSSKKIKPADYKVKEVAIPWLKINDVDSFYTVDMPGVPGTMEMFGVLNMKMNFDIISSIGYMVTAIPVPYDQKRVDSIMNSFAANLFNKKNGTKTKSIILNGISGKELESTDESGYKHGYILYKNHIIYIAMGIAMKKTVKSENLVNKFLSSYQVFEKKDSNKTGVYSYTDSIHLYTIDLPSKPQSGNDLIGSVAKDKSVTSHLMVCFDNQSGAYFFFGVNQAGPGYFIEDDSATLENIATAFKIKLAQVTLDTTYNEGESRVLKVEGIMAKINVFTRAYYIFKGNRWYALMAMYDSSKSNAGVEQFFKSFKMFDSPDLHWKQQSPQDGYITTWAPGNLQYFAIDSIEGSKYKKYETYDSTQGNNYDIIATGLSKYYWQNSDSAFWSRLQKSNVSYNDTVILQKPVTNGMVKGIELQLRQNNSFNIKRKRILLYGDSLYTLITVQPQQQINSNDVNKFFEDFRFNQPPPPSTIFTSKATQLINDLSNLDSLTKANARQDLATADFTVADLPLLYQALLKKYVAEEDDYKTVNKDIKEAIIGIKDPLGLQLAKEKYALSSDKQIKSLLLDIISGYKTKENFTDLKNLLLRVEPDTAFSYTFIGNLKDSLALSVDLIKNLLPFLKDTLIAPAIISICADLVDSNLMLVSTLKPHFENIAAFAEYRYNKHQGDAEENYYQDKFMISLLAKFNDVKSNAMLQKWLTLKDNYTNLRCIEALLINGQTIAAGPIIKLAEDRYYRIDLYNALKKQNKQALFPKKYLTQQYFAESNVYISASDDDEPTALSFISQKNTLFHGKKVRFFMYKVTYDDGDDKTETLACAGPYDINPLNLAAEDAHGYLYFKENFDRSNLQAQIDALIKQVEEDN